MIQKLVYGRGNERESERMQEALATLVDTHKLALPNAKLCAEEFFQKKSFLTCSFLLCCEKDKLFLAFYLILLFQGFNLCRVNTIFRLLLSANLFSMYAIYLFIYFSTVLM